MVVQLHRSCIVANVSYLRHKHSSYKVNTHGVSVRRVTVSVT